MFVFVLRSFEEGQRPELGVPPLCQRRTNTDGLGGGVASVQGTGFGCPVLGRVCHQGMAGPFSRCSPLGDGMRRPGSLRVCRSGLFGVTSSCREDVRGPKGQSCNGALCTILSVPFGRDDIRPRSVYLDNLWQRLRSQDSGGRPAERSAPNVALCCCCERICLCLALC